MSSPEYPNQPEISSELMFQNAQTLDDIASILIKMEQANQKLHGSTDVYAPDALLHQLDQARALIEKLHFEQSPLVGLNSPNIPFLIAKLPTLNSITRAGGLRDAFIRAMEDRLQPKKLAWATRTPEGYLIDNPLDEARLYFHLRNRQTEQARNDEARGDSRRKIREEVASYLGADLNTEKGRNDLREEFLRLAQLID